MTDLLSKFSEAAKELKTGRSPIWNRVNDAYVNHLGDISTDLLPEKLQIFFESVKLRLSSAKAIGRINDNEASYIAQDIMYLADVIRSESIRSQEIETTI